MAILIMAEVKKIHKIKLSQKGNYIFILKYKLTGYDEVGGLKWPRVLAPALAKTDS